MRLNGMNIARRRNPAAPPPGDLTVRLKDGREVNTTPEFVDKNGGLFTYDDYIKGALLNRFPKSDKIPFYAFSLNQKANSLYEAFAPWAKQSNRHERVDLKLEPMKGSVRGKDFLNLFDLKAVFPTQAQFSTSRAIDVTREHLDQLRAAYQVLIPWSKLGNDNAWKWADGEAYGGLRELISLREAFESVLGSTDWDSHVSMNLAERSKNLPLEKVLAIRQKWEEINTTPGSKAHLNEKVAEFENYQAEKKRKAAEHWASQSASTSASSSSSSSSSSASAPAAPASHLTLAQDISGMQYAQAMMLHDAMFGKKSNPASYDEQRAAALEASRKMREYMRRGGQFQTTSADTRPARPEAASAGTPRRAASQADPSTSNISYGQQDITGMQYAQAMQINDALFAKRNPLTRLNGLNVARKPVSRQVQERQALRSHLHEQRDEEAAQQADRALRARQQRQAQFVRHAQSVVDGLVKKYSAMGSRGTTFTRWNVIDDLLADPMIEKHIAIYIEDPLTVYITEAGKPAYRQKNRMLTEHLRDQALQHIADSASLMP